MQFEVTILGSGSATPTASTHPSAQYLNLSDRHYLIDCGEGTQMQMRRLHVRMQKISKIFISHLHGDHYFGLIGYLTTQSLLGRTNKLDVYSPEGLGNAIRTLLQVSDSRLSYTLNFISLDTTRQVLLFEDKVHEIYSFPLIHRIPCCGFLFREKLRERNIRKDALVKYNIPLEWMKRIKNGEDFINSGGELIPNSEITRDPLPPRSYAYCSDTAFSTEVISTVKHVDLLYHEATFGEEFRERAGETFHSTAADAARVAFEANAGKLLLGHLSARYDSPESLVDEARKIFRETYHATEGVTFRI